MAPPLRRFPWFIRWLVRREFWWLIGWEFGRFIWRELGWIHLRIARFVGRQLRVGGLVRLVGRFIGRQLGHAACRAQGSSCLSSLASFQPWLLRREFGRQFRRIVFIQLRWVFGRLVGGLLWRLFVRGLLVRLFDRLFNHVGNVVEHAR